MNSIWHSIEIDCIARELSYSEYLQLHASFKLQSAGLSENGYSLLKTMFDQELDAFNLKR